MANSKHRNIQRISNKKRGRPKVKFSIWTLILICVLVFGGFFALYMVTANLNPDFLDKEFGNSDSEIVESTTGETEENTDVEDAEEETTVPKVKITNPVPQSDAADSDYYSSSCLITDSTLLEIGNFTPFTDIIGNEDLNALNCNSTKIASNYGTVNAYETIQIKKPDNVYIMLGSDIGTDPVDEMIESYSKLVENLHSARPDMNIYIMQLLPVKAEGTDNSRNELINEYNSKLLKLANSNDVYCIDTNTVLKNQEGVLDPIYIDEETSKLNGTAYSMISDYILTHTVK